MNIYLYGNCQMTALGRMLLEQFPDWDVSSLDMSTLADPATAPEIARHLKAIRVADVVISQPVGEFRNDPQLSLLALRDEMRQQTQLITFPSIVFEGTHGAFTYLDQRFAGYHMPYHNSHTIDLLLRGYSWRDIHLLQSSLDFYEPEFVDHGIEASLAVLRSREEMHATTIRVSPMIDGLCRDRLLMNSINHPCRLLLARVLNEIYRTISVAQVAREEGQDYLLYPAVPPLPTVLHHLGLPDHAPKFQVPGQTWTREQYLRGSLMYYSRLLRPDLMRALAEARGSEFLRSFHEGSLSREGPGRAMLPQTVRAFADTVVSDVFEVLLNRAAGREEKEAHVLALQTHGMRVWLEAIATAEEFTRRFQSHEKSKLEADIVLQISRA